MNIITAVVLFIVFLGALYWAESIPTDEER